MILIEIFQYYCAKEEKREFEEREKRIMEKIGKKVIIHESRKIADLYT